MSVHSDDTDLLVLLPPDLYTVGDDVDFFPSREVESHEGFCYFKDMSLRRCGSADALTPPSRSSLRSRSLHGTPLKYTAPSPHRNLLTSESYLAQKYKDEQNLRDVDEYFKHCSMGGSCERPASPVPKLDLPQVQEILSQIDETERSIAEKCSNGERDDPYGGVRKALTFDSPVKSADQNHNGHYKSELSIRTDDESLLTLHGLWSGQQSTKVTLHEEMKVFKQRLEEERHRRQHCEDLIRELQSRLLETEEKLAVAMKVDHEKNVAIKKLKESWSRSVGQWKEADNKNSELSQKLHSVEKLSNDEKEELLSKVKKYETELLKSLELVHDYKQQQIQALADRDEAVSELNELKSTLNLKEADYQAIEKELGENVVLLQERDERIDKLTDNVRELGEKLRNLEGEKKVLMGEKQARMALNKKLEEALARERELQDQLRAAAKTKSDLKNFYQEQVENIVSEKQKHFQSQLENAERKLLKQFEMTEKELEESSNRDRQELCESHAREVQIMEEAHHERVEFYKVEMGLCKQKIDDLQELLARDKERSRELAHQVYAVFQNQWTETLKLIAPNHGPNEIGLGKAGGAMKRQGTFTMSDAQELLAAGLGSGTYRINETPQKIAPSSKPVHEPATAKEKLKAKNEKDKSPSKRKLF